MYDRVLHFGNTKYFNTNGKRGECLKKRDNGVYPKERDSEINPLFFLLRILSILTRKTDILKKIKKSFTFW